MPLIPLAAVYPTGPGNNWLKLLSGGTGWEEDAAIGKGKALQPIRDEQMRPSSFQVRHNAGVGTEETGMTEKIIAPITEEEESLAEPSLTPGRSSEV